MSTPGCDESAASVAESPQPECDCICHGVRGTPGQGGSFIWDDDRGIRHEDWFPCRCACEVTP